MLRLLIGRIALRSTELVTLLFATALFLLCDGSAIAQSRTRAGLQQYDWRETARLEHEDRKNRFRRLAAAGLIASPVFYEELIRKSDMPTIGADLPVLRLVFAQQVFFDTDKSELRPESLGFLNLVAESLRKDVPDVALFVAGHTDARGTDAYNYVLSVARADSVARYLFGRGIGLARLWRVGFGRAVPIQPNTTSENMAQNRRVEFLFGARPEAVAVWLARQSSVTCEGASPGEQFECRSRIATMPPIVASPVLNEQPTIIEPLQKRSDVIITSDRDITNASEGTTPADTISRKEVVSIEKNSQVIIDLKERRATVGAPQL